MKSKDALMVHLVVVWFISSYTVSLMHCGMRTMHRSKESLSNTKALISRSPPCAQSVVMSVFVQWTLLRSLKTTFKV